MFFSINLFIMCLSTCREVVFFLPWFYINYSYRYTVHENICIIHDEVVNISDKYLYFSYLLGEMQLETPLLEPTPELVTIIQIPERMACNSCNMEFQTREDQVLLLWWINNTLCKFKHDTMYTDIIYWDKIFCIIWFVVWILIFFSSWILIKWKKWLW